MNDKSYGIKKRNSQDFPAAGLRWNLVFNKGMNHVKVVAKKGSAIVEDSISFQYQTEKWGKPAKIVLEKIKEENGVVVLQATLLDSKGVLCLDSRDWTRFGIAGEGKLIDNQGTPGGSRLVQFANGRATIKVKAVNKQTIVSASVKDVPVVFVNL